MTSCLYFFRINEINSFFSRFSGKMISISVLFEQAGAPGVVVVLNRLFLAEILTHVKVDL